MLYRILLTMENSAKVRKHAKSFTLLEVIIAITLVSLAGPILFTVPFRLAKHEILALYDAELTRIADQEWNSLKLQFLQHEITWKSLADAETKPLVLEKKSRSIVFSERHRCSFIVEKIITQSQKKMLSGNREGRFIKVKISFLSETRGPKASFEYQIALSSENISKSTS